MDGVEITPDSDVDASSVRVFGRNCGEDSENRDWMLSRDAHCRIAGTDFAVACNVLFEGIQVPV